MRKVYILFVLATVVFLSNSGLHPSGNTNAPGDSFCGNCHSGNGGSLDGEISISGLPNTIMPSTTYQLTVTISNPAMNASKAGFQILALNQNNSNTGVFTNNSASSALRVQGSRTYLGHNPAVLFNGSNALTWTTDWTSPAGSSGDIITVYGSSVIANGSGSNSGDRSVFTTTSGSIPGGGSPLSLIVSADAGTLCSGTNDGQATAIPSGGQMPYSYAWDNGETTMQAIALSGGPHSVTVTDGTNTTANGNITISSPAPLIVTNAGQEDVTCFGGQDGFAQINTSGGTPSYTYEWSDGGSGANRFDLFTGIYQVSVTDFNDCLEIISFTIGQPDEIEVIDVITNVSCYGGSNGSIVLNTSGGTGTLLYNWDNGSTNKDQFGLPTGLYNLTITDDNNCSKELQYQVFEPSTPLFIDVVFAINVTCFGDSDGISSLTPSGGTGAYTFDWSDGGTGSDRNDLSAGDYTVTLSDANNCEETTFVNIGTPTAITIDSVMAIPASCQGANDGALEVSSLGGVGNRNYLWSNGSTQSILTNVTSGSYIVTVTDDNNCQEVRSFTLNALNAATLSVDLSINTSCNGSSDGLASVNLTNGVGYTTMWSNGIVGDTVQGLVAGIYTAQASDTSGCISNILTFEINQPDSIKTDSVILNMPFCFGDTTGNLMIFPVGGSGLYAYNWSNGDSLNSIVNLDAGIYSVIITDENLCSAVDTFALSEPAALVIDSTYVLDLLCNGDSSGYVEILASGGTGDLTYNWSNGDSSEIISMVPSGNYIVEILDANQCSLSDSFIVLEPQNLTLSSTVTNESNQGLADGSITLYVSGGTEGYMYLWNTGAITDSIGGLLPSNYIVTVTDTNGCMITKKFTVQSGSCALSAEFTTTDVSCFDGTNGSIILDITDNIGDLTIIISGGQTDILNLTAGIYDITVTDSAMCSFNLSGIEITQPAEISIIVDNINGSDATSNGEISITPSGGVSPYSYVWKDINSNDVSNLEDLAGMPAGIYFLIITDSNGCTFSLDDLEIPMISSVSESVNSIKVYPSPVTTTLFVQSSFIIEKAELFNINGIILRKIEPKTSFFQIDVNSLNFGLYFLKIESMDGSILTKIIVE